MNVDELETERLVLTPISLADSPGMFLLWSDPEVCRYSGPIHDVEGRPVPSPVSHPSESDRIIDFWERASVAGWGLRWAIRERSSGDFLGTTGFNSLATCAEYAYHLRQPFWGRGFMSEATVAALAWVRRAGSTQVEAFIEPANENSIEFAERHAFERTGEVQDGALRFVKRLG
ncbi:MAG: GNAT family N-acetyltransferase [Actinomycetota bacterium]